MIAALGPPIPVDWIVSGRPSSASPVYAAGGGAGSPAAPGSLLAAMKEELFALETDKLQGRLTESEYVEQKAALEVVLRRAAACRRRTYGGYV